MRVSERLRVLLQERGITQAALANHLECSKPFISLVVNGKKNMPLDMIERTCAFLGITLSEFFREGPEEEAPDYVRSFFHMIRMMSKEEIAALRASAELFPSVRQDDEGD